MAQFDVYPNPGRNRTSIPFVVLLQNRRFDVLGSRFVAALVSTSVAQPPFAWPAPVFRIAAQDVFLDVSNLLTIPANRLGAPVATLSDEDSRARLVRALDEFLSQA